MYRRRTTTRRPRRRTYRGRGERILSEEELLKEALQFKPMDEVFKPKPKIQPVPMPPAVRHQSEVYPFWKFALGNAGSKGGIAHGVINWARSHADNRTVSKWLDSKGHSTLAKFARFVGLGRKRHKPTLKTLMGFGRKHF